MSTTATPATAAATAILENKTLFPLNLDTLSYQPFQSITKEDCLHYLAKLESTVSPCDDSLTLVDIKGMTFQEWANRIYLRRPPTDATAEPSDPTAERSLSSIRAIDVEDPHGIFGDKQLKLYCTKGIPGNSNLRAMALCLVDDTNCTPISFQLFHKESLRPYGVNGDYFEMPCTIDPLPTRTPSYDAPAHPLLVLRLSYTFFDVKWLPSRIGAFFYLAKVPKQYVFTNANTNPRPQWLRVVLTEAQPPDLNVSRTDWTVKVKTDDGSPLSFTIQVNNTDRSQLSFEIQPNVSNPLFTDHLNYTYVLCDPNANVKLQSYWKMDDIYKNMTSSTAIDNSDFPWTNIKRDNITDTLIPLFENFDGMSSAFGNKPVINFLENMLHADTQKLRARIEFSDERVVQLFFKSANDSIPEVDNKFSLSPSCQFVLFPTKDRELITSILRFFIVPPGNGAANGSPIRVHGMQQVYGSNGNYNILRPSVGDNHNIIIIAPTTNLITEVGKAFLQTRVLKDAMERGKHISELATGA